MTVKPNTWHYRLASFYGQGDYYRRTNLCSYFWHFMFGVVLCAFIACASALAAYFLLMGPVFWIVLCITDWHLYRMEVDAFAGFLFWGLAALGIGFAFYASWREAGDEPFLPIPQPVREAYRGWKEKYCPIVEIAE
jgi:hypothetical protein